MPQPFEKSSQGWFVYHLAGTTWQHLGQPDSSAFCPGPINARASPTIPTHSMFNYLLVLWAPILCSQVAGYFLPPMIYLQLQQGLMTGLFTGVLINALVQDRSARHRSNLKGCCPMYAGHTPNLAFVSCNFGGHSLATLTAIHCVAGAYIRRPFAPERWLIAHTSINVIRL